MRPLSTLLVLGLLLGLAPIAGAQDADEPQEAEAEDIVSEVPS